MTKRQSTKSVAECFMSELRSTAEMADEEPQLFENWKGYVDGQEVVAGELWSAGHLTDDEHKEIIQLTGRFTGTKATDFTYPADSFEPIGTFDICCATRIEHFRHKETGKTWFMVPYLPVSFHQTLNEACEEIGRCI